MKDAGEIFPGQDTQSEYTENLSAKWWYNTAVKAKAGAQRNEKKRCDARRVQTIVPRYIRACTWCLASACLLSCSLFIATCNLEQACAGPQRDKVTDCAILHECHRQLLFADREIYLHLQKMECVEW